MTEPNTVPEPNVEPAVEPVAPAVEPVAVIPAVEPAPAPVETPEQKDEVRQNRIQKRIDKLTAEKYELKGRLETLERMVQQQPQTRQQADEPVRDNYETDLAYLEARQDYKISKVNSERDALARQEHLAVQQTAMAEKENAVRQQHPDYDEVIADAGDIPISNAACDAILGSDLGVELRYHLAKNPQEAARLNLIRNPVDLGRAMGQLEAKILAAKQQPKQPPRVPSAPPPIKPVGTSGGTVEVDESKMTDAEYMASLRKKGLVPK